MQTPGNLIKRSAWAYLVSPLWAECVQNELSMSLQLTPWACCELFVRSSQWAHHAVVAVSSLCELQTHGKLTASSQCELILWVPYELPVSWVRKISRVILRGFFHRLLLRNLWNPVVLLLKYSVGFSHFHYSFDMAPVEHWCLATNPESE